MEALELIAVSVSSALATACGIGGGAVYSSFLLGIQEFEPSEAFPISNCIILFCGIVTFINRILDKYEHPKSKFVNYELAIIFGPAMLLGAKIGTICNLIFNKLLLTILLFVILINSLSKNLKNIKKAKEKEEKYDQELLMAENNGGLEEALIPKSQRKNYDEIVKSSDKGKILSQEEKKFLKRDEQPLRFSRIFFMLFLELLLIADQMVEGNIALSSWFNIPRCSTTYWIIFASYIAISFIMIIIGYKIAKSHLEKRKKIGILYNGLRSDTLSENAFSIVINAILAGIISPTIGIGGGMIINPIINNLGLEPKESSATSNFLIITTAIASSILFICSGQLNIQFTLILGAPCVFCAFLGSFFILAYINRTKKNSFLLVTMFYIMFFSMIILLIRAYVDWGQTRLLDILVIKSYC